MMSHELARMLLALPNKPVATFANNHTFCGGTAAKLRVGNLLCEGGEHIIIGNMTKMNVGANERITHMYNGPLPKEWNQS